MHVYNAFCFTGKVRRLGSHGICGGHEFICARAIGCATTDEARKCSRANACGALQEEMPAGDVLKVFDIVFHTNILSAQSHGSRKGARSQRLRSAKAVIKIVDH